MTFNPSKRQFLKTSLGTGAAAAMLASFPPSIRRALAIEANNATGTIQDVKHVVMVMLENRSFDNYFGTFKGVRGYGDRFAIPLPNGKNAFFQTDANGNTLTPYHLDETQGNAQRAGGTPHTWPDAQAAWDHGRMDRWPVAKKALSMGYYDNAEIPFQRALADAFTLCDAYHCAMHTGTIPNRLFYWTGSNGPTGDNVAVMVNEFNAGADVGPSTEGWTWKTYADRLQGAGVSWKVYQNVPDNYGCNQMMSFRHWRAEMEKMPDGRKLSNTAGTGVNPPYNPDIDDQYSPLAKGFCNTMPDGGFLQSLRDDVLNGRLPQVSWIIPPAEFSEHPGPSSPAKGGWYVQSILDALTASPEVWSKTVLLINFDENDGFFDHSPPPTAPSRNPDGTLAGKSTLDDAQMAYEYFNFPPATAKQPPQDGKPFGPGPRVPLWVVSPWSRGGWVNSEVFDHTSVLRFLEARFGVMEPQISAYRRAVCGDLTSAFNFATPNTETLPVLAGRTTRADATSLTAWQQTQPAIPVPASPALPAQATGARPSRKLPYELHTSARVDAAARSVRLLFANGSAHQAGAVFHVYDKLHLDRIPRRYVVEAGKALDDAWDVNADGGKYDLWVLGPNGYHRAFTGDVTEAATTSAEIQVCYNPCRKPTIQVKLHNDGDADVTFTVKALAYRDDGPWTQRVRRGKVETLEWPVAESGNWYDFVVTCEASPAFARRFAGRMETGADTVSDPAMGVV
ncbi:phosphocholine-specific phospholipase C [Cupriavidus neocaledonicus]|uniref:phospholipase C n=1 Tax=Cupriavidus neocaledonicus TaxID=1040979 RepID=A0A375HVL7_9BURK|nr:phospholipase C, phosphocholine-specific [Cupriavidus neocaledonicus]SOZ39898.1 PHOSPHOLIPASE C (PHOSPHATIDYLCHOLINE CHOLINEPHOSPHOHYDROLASE) (Phosphatidylcholine-hydrolyzing phospholipase C) SIGNAL PEPTIDE PROTEIN [Cupriavidus neocaledonicus]SPD60767.1 Non-hemolytic phospholipase C [Cupriavidus neocaledonicus]